MAFKISLKIGDKTFAGKGDTALAALENLEKPDKHIFIKTLVTIKANGKTRTYPLLPIRARRYFQRIVRPYLAKELEILMK